MDSFFKVDELLAGCEEEPFLIFHFEFNQADAVGPVGHLGRGLEGISGFAGGQEVNILLERDGRFSEAVTCCLTGLIGY